MLDFYKSVLQRWLDNPSLDHDEFEQQLLLCQRKFKSYKYSIFVLQHNALKIQHWYFKLKLQHTLQKCFSLRSESCNSSFQQIVSIEDPQKDESMTQQNQQSVTVGDIHHSKGILSVSMIDSIVEQSKQNSQLSEHEAKEILLLANEICFNSKQTSSSSQESLLLSITSEQFESMTKVIQTPKFDEKGQSSQNKIFTFDGFSEDMQMFDQNFNSNTSNVIQKQNKIVSKAVPLKSFKNPFRNNNQQQQESLNDYDSKSSSIAFISAIDNASHLIDDSFKINLHKVSKPQPQNNQQKQPLLNQQQHKVSPYRVNKENNERFNKLKQWIKLIDNNIHKTDSSQNTKVKLSEIEVHESRDSILNIKVYQNSSQGSQFNSTNNSDMQEYSSFASQQSSISNIQITQDIKMLTQKKNVIQKLSKPKIITTSKSPKNNISKSRNPNSFQYNTISDQIQTRTFTPNQRRTRAERLKFRDISNNKTPLKHTINETNDKTKSLMKINPFSKKIDINDKDSNLQESYEQKLKSMYCTSKTTKGTNFWREINNLN